MRSTLRKIGNSRGVLIPAALLTQCGIVDEVDLLIEDGRIVIEPHKPSRTGWYDNYEAAGDVDVWETMPSDADSEDWEW